jgi:hypothetical protein
MTFYALHSTFTAASPAATAGYGSEVHSIYADDSCLLTSTIFYRSFELQVSNHFGVARTGQLFFIFRLFLEQRMS